MFKVENEISRTTGLNRFVSGQTVKSALMGRRQTHGPAEARAIVFIGKAPFLLLLQKVVNRWEKAEKSAFPKLVI